MKPFGTEDCRVKSSAEREAESSVNLLMLQYLPIRLFESITCLSLGADGRQHSSPLPQPVFQVMEQGSECAAASPPFFSYLICNSLLSSSVTENKQRQTWQCAIEHY